MRIHLSRWLVGATLLGLAAAQHPRSLTCAITAAVAA